MKNMTVYLCILIIVGVLLNLLYEPFVGLIPGATYPNLNKVLMQFCSPIKFVSALLILTGLIPLIGERIFKFFWNNYLQVPFNNFNEVTEKHLNKISEHVTSISQDIDDYIKKRGGPLTIHECKNIEDYKDYLGHASIQVYGAHVASQDSLHQFIKQRLLDSFNFEPYRLNVRKEISISPYPPDEDFVQWHEKTEYTIHHILFAKHHITTVWDLEFKLKSYAPGMAPENWAGATSLVVNVDDKKLIDSEEKPTVENNITDDGFFCWNEEEWIILRYCSQLKLEKEYTKVTIIERTINSRKDKTYSINTKRPTFGHYVDFTLPSEYSFMTDPYLSPQVAIQGLPSHKRKEIDVDKFIIINHDADNHIRVELRDWIMPGIIMNLNWIEIQKE